MGIRETEHRKKERRYMVRISFTDIQLQRWWKKIKQIIKERKETK